MLAGLYVDEIWISLKQFWLNKSQYKLFRMFIIDIKQWNIKENIEISIKWMKTVRTYQKSEEYQGLAAEKLTRCLIKVLMILNSGMSF